MARRPDPDDPDGDPGYAERLEAAKQASVGQLLIRAARLLDERAIARARQELGLPGLRRSHLALAPHIDLEGTRTTEIARRAGVSKQAVNQMVADLEHMGMLQRRPDPEDGRAKRVVFTARGRDAMLRGLAVLGRLESELRAEVGDPTMDELHAALRRVCDALQ